MQFLRIDHASDQDRPRAKTKQAGRSVCRIRQGILCGRQRQPTAQMEIALCIPNTAATVIRAAWVAHLGYEAPLS